MNFSTRGKPFNLLRSFSILSLVAIVLITSVSATLLSRFLTRNMLSRDGMITLQFVQSIAQINDPSLYFSNSKLPESQGSFQKTPETSLALANNTALEEFFDHIVVIPEVLRANVYNDEKRIIWSSNAHLVGKQFLDNPELQDALAGHLNIKTGVPEERHKAEHVEFEPRVSRFVENYIPIWNHPGTDVMGVVEVYREPHALFDAIARGERLVWSSAIVGGLILYASLFWIVRRGAHLIQRQQEQLIESETMATVGEMTSAIAHNLRNSLAAIRSSAEITAEDDRIELMRESATDIIASVDQLEQWIRQLFDYTRPIQHVPSAVDIRATLEEALRPFQATLSQQRVKLALTVDDTLPPVPADAHLIQQALHILIANALDAMLPGGTLTISAQWTKDRRHVQLRFTDTGAGISADQIDKIFRPFFTTKRKGLGVGLALAKRIVSRHGGTIDITSEAVRGTTVSIILPLSE